MIAEQSIKMRKRPASTILITGAGSGLGRALAREYAAPGISLYLSGRNLDPVEETAVFCRRLGAKAIAARVDVTDLTAVQSWVESIAKHETLDLVISNAGLLGSHGVGREFENAQTAISQIETNLCGCVNLVTSIVPHMQKNRHGHIALISSMSALQPIADMPAYAASKAGVNAYGEAIGAYLERDGVDVTVVCPGYIKSDMGNQYESWRPIEMSPEKAASKIKNGLERRKPFLAFPLPLLWSIALGRFLPWSWRRVTTKPFNYRQ